jgi:hypothetical protein
MGGRGKRYAEVNAGGETFNLIAVFASKSPDTRRIGPNPLIPVGQNREEPRHGSIP